jgi:serine protease Do
MMRRHFWTGFLVIGLLALSLPAGLAQEVGEPDPGWMGVQLGGSRAPAGEERKDAPAGAVVRAVVKDGPAARAGLRARDRISAVEGSAVSSPRDLVRQVKSRPPGSWVELTVLRDGDERQIAVRLDSWPEDTRGLQMRRGWIGVEGIELPPALREHFGAPESSGVMISDVVTGSPAEAAGFRLGDVLYEVEDAPIGSVRELQSWVRFGGMGNTLELTVMRNGVRIVLEAVVAEAPERRSVPAVRRREPSKPDE